MPKQFISFDIETDFRRKLLNIGWCTSNNEDHGKEFFVWQNEDSLYYPNDCDHKYTAILKTWRKAEKTPIGEVLTQFLKDVGEKTVVGWNIKPFDIPIIAGYVKKYLNIDWHPNYFDGYKTMKVITKNNERLVERLIAINGTTKSGKFPSMTAEAMFKFVTGCDGYSEHHSALYDAQDERLLIQNMKKLGVNPYQLSEKY